MPFVRPEHNIIAEVLASMNSDLLADAKCWFGGGTAIVLSFGEYRRSLDLGFLCADRDGYRKLREAFFDHGIRALFPEPIEVLRDVRADSSGIRMGVRHKDQPIKFEIVREARIDLDGTLDELLHVPTLSPRSMFAEKLLANADRCQDRAVAYRDAIDLGRLVEAHGSIPDDAIEISEAAYGHDIARKLTWVLNRLQRPEELRHAAQSLDMDLDTARSSIHALRDAGRKAWPDADIEENPALDEDSHPSP